MKTKKIAIVLLISLFVICLAFANNEATLSKSDIQKEQKVERVKVEKVEAEKEVVEKAELPNLSSKGDVAVEKKVTLIEVKKGEKPIRTAPEIKKVDKVAKEVAEKLAVEKAKRAMVPSKSAKGTEVEVHIDKELELHGPTTIVPLKEIGARLVGDDCSDPILVTIPTDLPYSDLGQTTCGRGNNYDATCLFHYDGGEDIIYELTVTSEVTVSITMDPLGSTWTGIAIDYECPPASFCLAFETGSSGIRVLLLTLYPDPGTYYLMVDTWASPNYPCIPEFNLTIDEFIPEPGETCEAAIPYTYVGDASITGPLDPYQAVWYSFESTEEYSEIYVDLCASDFNTKLEVWYNCDDPGYAYYNDNSLDICGGMQSYIQTGGMFLGDVCYAKVYGYDFASGTYVLDITGLPGTCPEAPPNDDCEDAEYVAPPYPAIGSGTTIAATLDCPGVLDWNGVWYLFDLPYAENAVTIDICGVDEDLNTDCFGAALMDDCLCDDYILRDDGYFYECPSGFDGFHMEWWNIPGPGQMYWPAYAVASGDVGMDFDYIIDVQEIVPCVVECPEWGIPEGEACLIDGDVDNFNGGCNSDPPVFSSIASGETICGTASTFIFDGANCRDTDWYEVILEENFVTLTWEGEAEFQLQLSIIDAGSGDCLDYTIIASGDGNPCDFVSITANVTAGTYWLWAGPSVFDGWPCSDDHYDYVATLTCEPKYCFASGGCEEYLEHIERIEIGTIDNSSGCNQYADYTYLSTDLDVGVAASLTVTIANSWPLNFGGAWVDWNQDLDFYDDGEFFYLGTGFGPYIADIIPPVEALAGPTRMRIRLCYDEVLDPCGATYWGEVEDYTVNVIPSTEPVLCVFPPSYNFGGVPIGNCSPPQPQTFIIDNCGTGTIEVYSITITGPDADEFILTDANTYPVTLPPAITVGIEFCPADAGTKTAFLTITDDREVTDWPLYGTGYVGLVCPEGTIFGQPSHMPEDDWSAATSDNDPVYCVYDNFWGLEEPICNIHFWGLSLICCWENCFGEDPMTFEIKFYLDDAGYPGDEVCSYTETIYREATEQYYTGFPLYYYSTELEPCCEISDGWVSIQGVSLGEPTNCWFMWMSSGIGDGFCYQSIDDGVTFNNRFYDQSLCLTGEPPLETSLILPEYVEGCPGEAVSIPVYLDNTNAWEIEGIDMTVTFDETVLDATDATLTAGVLEGLGYEIVFDTTVDGQVSIVIYATLDLFSGSGDIAFLEFDVLGAEGTYSDLTFTFGEIDETPVGLFDGFFNVVPCAFDISGFIGYYDGLAPVPNADVNLDSYAATTDEFGEYLFEDIPGGDYGSTPFKDTDLGGLSGLDASRIARFAAGLYTLNCLEMIAGDVSMNGEISGMDASRVARYIAGLITELNDDGIDWVFTPEPIPDCADWPPIVYENTREYSPLNSDLTDEDFIGIRLGDVSGNWAPDVQARVPEISPEATEIDVEVNSTLRIPVTIDKVSAIEGIDISIAFDKEALSLTGLTLNDGILANNDYAVEINLKESKVVIYAQKELVSGAGVFAFMDFDVIGEVGSSSEIYLTRFDVNETEASGGFNVLDSENETVTRRLQINVGQTLLEKFVLYPNKPNPFSARTLIQYDLPKDTYVNIQVYNVKGQLVEELVNGVESAGRKQIEWDSKDSSSGIYFCRLSTEDKTIIKKMVLMR